MTDSRQSKYMTLKGKLLTLLFCICLFLPLFEVDTAHAQSRQCRALNAQLASLGSQRGSSSEYRKFDRAVRDQTIQLDRTKRLARRNRCNFGIFSKRGGQCSRIKDTLGRMESNLRNLKRQRARFSPNNAGSTKTKNRILRQLKRLGCNGNARNASQKPQSDRRRTLLEQVFGVNTYNERGYQNQQEPAPQRRFGRTFRTLCVRKSDGYYFPISFSTTKKYFGRDSETCSAMCPGDDVALYHHQMPGQDSEQMVEYGSDQPYASKPFAFAYRKKVDQNRSCRFATAETAAGDFQMIAGGGGANKAKQTQLATSVQRLGVPIFKKDPHISPSDYENELALFSEETAIEYLRKARNPAASGLIAGNGKTKNIRIVGPAFFPVQ